MHLGSNVSTLAYQWSNDISLCYSHYTTSYGHYIKHIGLKPNSLNIDSLKRGGALYIELTYGTADTEKLPGGVVFKGLHCTQYGGQFYS